MSSTWTIRISAKAKKQLKALDKPTAKRIMRYLQDLQNLENPRTRGKGLTGNLSGTWRYRVGSYRIIATIEDDELIIYAVSIDHRSRVYR